MELGTLMITTLRMGFQVRTIFLMGWKDPDIINQLNADSRGI